MKRAPIIAGHVVPDGAWAPLVETAWAPGDGHSAPLRAALQDQGYVLVRGAIPREAVLDARAEVFARLAEVDEVCEPSAEGVATAEALMRALGLAEAPRLATAYVDLLANAAAAVSLRPGLPR